MILFLSHVLYFLYLGEVIIFLIVSVSDIYIVYYSSTGIMIGVYGSSISLRQFEHEIKSLLISYFERYNDITVPK